MKTKLFALVFAFLISPLAKGAEQTESKLEAINAPTEFVTVGETRYAYRKIGEDHGRVPLVLLQHTRGTMDNWDPALLDHLAKNRLVIIFDNKGISRSTGETPSSFAEMARDAGTFVEALSLKKIDVLGFSIGGAVAQELILQKPMLVRRAVLAGTSARGGEGVNNLSEKSKAVSTKDHLTDDDQLYAFFAPSETSQKMGRSYLERIKRRKKDVEPPVSMAAVHAQAVARQQWGNPQPTPDERMKMVKIPILVANGKEDIRMPTINSYHLFGLLPRAQLILYPDSGHGFLFQYPELCGENFDAFLREDEVQEAR